MPAPLTSPWRRRPGDSCFLQSLRDRLLLAQDYGFRRTLETLDRAQNSKHFRGILVPQFGVNYENSSVQVPAQSGMNQGGMPCQKPCTEACRLQKLNVCAML